MTKVFCVHYAGEPFNLRRLPLTSQAPEEPGKVCTQSSRCLCCEDSDSYKARACVVSAADDTLVYRSPCSRSDADGSSD